jgi:hypothetical protein
MNKNIILSLITLAGAIVGYCVAHIGNPTYWRIIMDIIYGGFLFWNLGRAFFIKYYAAFLGPILGLLISVGLDLIAGGEIVIRNKLLFMCLGLAFWGFLRYWKPLLIGGIIGGCIGFVLGLELGIWVGSVHFQPGTFSASLWAIQTALMGMYMTQVFIAIYESKRVIKHPTPS